MNPFIKALLDAVVKPGVDAKIADLKTNEQANVATIEAMIAEGGLTAPIAVGNFLVAKVKAPNAFIAGIESYALPALEAGVALALSAAGNSVPTLYAAGLAFLEKEDAYL